MTDKPADIDAYIAGLPEPVRPTASALRALMREAAPHSGERIRYGMPAFDLGGGRFLYFAVWKRHVGLYPIYRGPEALEAEIAAHRSGKDTVQFSLATALPAALITRIVQAQAARETA